ncbi:protein-glutamate methylesterase/protein-glutamine glutaminase [Anaeromyxobacter dehalogenans]|uniref:Protein-glutamate methylesterase/protein-glutamine glutaminase 1 n=1 Tax=Anaeromyxobacter dehalogenans (strain 2CP-C) TaxID=290397 RepID=CHEB1_ANADE|nr:chemotaxis response regulator protein-glutamate methylesterase [Anaeromyxobacter dehalogenans]Q2INJ8.1 RecName: Full=Protein-glutamate methylesterase/protein-glutamine glutaminase 1 [Anaeromyxobacter dehalogenans 2CP-C]ABC80376.1 response regulator receiver (CheY-like) modulated CheB methylesterase [Anaeromyxobacter dehalogenans 2CP-C]
MAPRILVVDDSAVVRMALSQILGRAGLEVETAIDPLVAMDKMRRARPDAIVLDIEMPRMDGLTFLDRVMAQDPVPVVVCSGLAGPGSEVALHALEHGAVDVIEKPRLGVKGFLEDSARRIVEVVRAATQARLRARVRALRPLPRPPAGAQPRPAPRLAPRAGRAELVVVGASTGGTEALRVLLEAMPADAPAIAVVQHMPEVFTAQFAKRLDKLCRIEVKEAADGDRLLPGRALVAPGNRHLSVKRAGGLVAVVSDGPPVSLHRPSVNVLFHSAARVAGPGTLGILLTGMGDDGADGLLELRRAGAHTVAQDESTSVVFGMPKEAIARGAAVEVLPLPRVASAVLAWAR